MLVKICLILLPLLLFASPAYAACVNTAVGCVPTDAGGLTQTILDMIIGIAGGAALILMITGSIEMIISQGDAAKIKAGQEKFVSSLMGLVFIIFSIVLLRIIGVDILQLPGFSK